MKTGMKGLAGLFSTTVILTALVSGISTAQPLDRKGFYREGFEESLEEVTETRDRAKHLNKEMTSGTGTGSAVAIQGRGAPATIDPKLTGVEAIRTDYHGNFWTINITIRYMALKMARENNKTCYDIFFIFHSSEKTVLYNKKGSSAGWEDYYHTLTLRTSNYRQSLDYWEMLKDIFDNKTRAIVMFGTDTCKDAFTDYSDPTMKRRDCVVDLDSDGKGYFELWFDNVASK